MTASFEGPKRAKHIINMADVKTQQILAKEEYTTMDCSSDSKPSTNERNANVNENVATATINHHQHQQQQQNRQQRRVHFGSVDVRQFACTVFAVTVA